MICTPLTQRLGLKHPIIQAPMALAAGGKLAAAVDSAGGLGLIGGGYGQSDWLEDQFRVAGNNMVGCGFITWSLAEHRDLLDKALDHNPKVVMLSFGDIAPFAGQIKARNIPLIAQVQTVGDALAALDEGADIIVAQGAEGGGHGLKRATFTLVPEIADHIYRQGSQAILCAAGGIADGRGLAAALGLGADGVLVGTRFWAATEALVHPNMHNAAIKATGDQTIRSTVMDMARQRHWPEGFTARVLANDFIDKWHGREAELAEKIDIIIPQYQKAWEEGDIDMANVFVGEATGLIADIQPAAEIIASMVEQAEKIIRKQQGYIQ